MLDSLFTEVRNREKRFIVYRSGDETDIETQFASHNVSVTHRELPSEGPDPFLVIEENGEFAGALALSDLEGLLEPPLVRPGKRDDVSEGYRALFDVLDETVFTTMERRQLLAVSREIEDRAFRVGTGTLSVGFQSLSTFKSQIGVYRQLATATDLDIHIYGAADWAPPVIERVTYHRYADDALEQYWVLAFDGGPDEMQASGLVARERPDGYDGFWTDDAEIVEDIRAALTRE